MLGTIMLVSSCNNMGQIARSGLDVGTSGSGEYHASSGSGEYYYRYSLYCVSCVCAGVIMSVLTMFLINYDSNLFS